MLTSHTQLFNLKYLVTHIKTELKGYESCKNTEIGEIE